MHEGLHIRETKERNRLLIPRGLGFQLSTLVDGNNTWQWKLRYVHHADCDVTHLTFTLSLVNTSAFTKKDNSSDGRQSLELLQSLGNLDSIFRTFLTLYCFLCFDIYFQVFHNRVFLDPWPAKDHQAPLELSQR